MTKDESVEEMFRHPHEKRIDALCQTQGLIRESDVEKLFQSRLKENLEQIKANQQAMQEQLNRIETELFSLKTWHYIKKQPL
jgi:pyruvate-formate lyase-activating enzyme